MLCLADLEVIGIYYGKKSNVEFEMLCQQKSFVILAIKKQLDIQKKIFWKY